MLIDGTYGAFIHIGENMLHDARFGWLQKVMLTPSHHRVHHARNPLYMDTNFCNLLNVWDRIFGTFSKEIKETDPPIYGLTTNIETYAPLRVATHEYQSIIRDVRRATRLSDKLKYIFYAPGWSHDGEDKRAKVLRKKLNELQHE